MTDDSEVAQLSEAQREFLRCYPNKGGRPHGLVRRGYLMYRWGYDASFGYAFTAKGYQARAYLQSKGGDAC